MTSIPKSAQQPQGATTRKRPTTDSKRLGAAIMASIKRLELLNGQLEALCSGGAR